VQVFRYVTDAEFEAEKKRRESGDQKPASASAEQKPAAASPTNPVSVAGTDSAAK